VSRSLDRNRQRTLVSGAGAKLAPRLDLASLRDVAAQARGIFVIDLPDLVDAESADLAPPAEAATTPPRSAPAAARATRAARTTPATRTAPAARTVTPARTLALGTPSEPRPRRFAIWTASAVPYSPLSGFVIAHVALMLLDLFVSASPKMCHSEPAGEESRVPGTASRFGRDASFLSMTRFLCRCAQPYQRFSPPSFA
jgi:hypothetical protein